MKIQNHFISYTLSDTEVTKDLLTRLKRSSSLNVDTFVDCIDNDSVSRQDRVITELHKANKLILLRTPSILQSKWVRYEVATACELNIPIEIIESSKIRQHQVTMNKHRVFISYHHTNDQWAKNRLIDLNKQFKFFIDESVDTGDIPDHWDNQKIREEIRDHYLKSSTVTVLLVGTETKYRKHIDWELYSSMINGKLNKKSGIVVIMLPATGCNYCQAMHEGEKNNVFPQIDSWTKVNTREEFEKRFPYMPNRIIDNLVSGAKISVANWNELTVEKLAVLIDNAANDRFSFEYDLKRAMKRYNDRN